MDKNFSFLKYLSQTFMIYGIITALLNIFCVLFGSSAYEFSTIFSLGSSGIGTATSFQFFIAVSVMSALRFIFMTDTVIKKMSLAARIIAMFSAAFAAVTAFIFLFDWFPADMPIAWIMFIVCFIVCSAVSTAISVISERRENRRLEEALKRYKEEQ